MLAPPPTPPAPSSTEQQLFAQNVKDIYFDYDKSDISMRISRRLCRPMHKFLQQHPNIRITIEGHCDERGSTEYNLALGTNRADAVKNALVQSRRRWRSHQDHQLWQRKAVLHRIERSLLAAESPWALRLRTVAEVKAK